MKAIRLTDPKVFLKLVPFALVLGGGAAVSMVHLALLLRSWLIGVCALGGIAKMVFLASRVGTRLATTSEDAWVG